MRRLPILLVIFAGGLSATPAVAQSWRVPPGHLPPPGQCRVWYPDRPPGHQPPPTSCRRAARDAWRHGGRVIRGGYDGYDPRDQDRARWNHERRANEHPRYGQDRRWDYDDSARYHRGDRFVTVCVQRDWNGRCLRTELRPRW